MDNQSLIQNLIIGLTSGTIPLLAVIIYLFMHPEKFDAWTRIFYNLLYNLFSTLPKIKHKIDKRLVASSIQDTVNTIGSQINSESPDALPHALKIEWVCSDTPESFIEKGKAVVRLKHYSNQDKNIVDSTLLYLKRDLLPRAKYYVDQTLRLSCVYKIASRIFISRRDTGAYDYFMENELNPTIRSDNMVETDLQILQNLDSVGFFTRVFLTEITVTGQKLLGLVPTTTVRNELREFAQFLEVIATKGKEEDVPLQFRGAKVNAAVILVARSETIRAHGIYPYINRVKRCLQEGIDSIYLTAWGVDFVKAVIKIKTKIEKNLVTILRRYNYSLTDKTKAILLLCQPKASFLAQQKQLHEEVTNALADIVPEIREGTIKIMAIARTKNVGFKVAITSVDKNITNPKACCIDRLSRIKERFPNEFVGIVLWSEDIKEFVINSLVPLTSKYVNKVEFDDENLIVNIQVISKEAAGKAIGKNGYNVRLAIELTGWFMNINPGVEQNIVASQEVVK
jgi:transcription antitermination factor NusA-like protein